MPRRNGEAAIAPFAHRLGREPDHVIAREAGVSRAFIVNYRKRAGIRPYEGYKFGGGAAAPESAGPAARTRRSAPETKRVGAPTAAPLARRRESPTAPVAAVSVVYRIVVDDAGLTHEYAVVAQTLVEAVALAERAFRDRHPAGRLRGVERVAALLTRQ
jgi:hypothetical protein